MLLTYVIMFLVVMPLELSEYGSCPLYVVRGKTIAKHIVGESLAKLFNERLK